MADVEMSRATHVAAGAATVHALIDGFRAIGKDFDKGLTALKREAQG